MCELEDLKDQLDMEVRLREQAENKVKEQAHGNGHSSTSAEVMELRADRDQIQADYSEMQDKFNQTQGELADLTVFLSQFEGALLDELKKSTSGENQLPNISDSATKQERLQICISSYFNFQEKRNKELMMTMEKLSQLEAAIMNNQDENMQDLLNETRDNFNTQANEPIRPPPSASSGASRLSPVNLTLNDSFDSLTSKKSNTALASGRNKKSKTRKTSKKVKAESKILEGEVNSKSPVESKNEATVLDEEKIEESWPKDSQEEVNFDEVDLV